MNLTNDQLSYNDFCSYGKQIGSQFYFFYFFSTTFSPSFKPSGSGSSKRRGQASLNGMEEHFFQVFFSFFPSFFFGFFQSLPMIHRCFPQLLPVRKGSAPLIKCAWLSLASIFSVKPPTSSKQ